MTTSFRLRYRSLRALDADHGAYLTHGGMLVPWPDNQPPPPMNVMVSLVIEAPSGRTFEFEARVGQSVPGRGFMTSFSEGSRPTLIALDAFVDSEVFRQTLASELVTAGTSDPRVTREEGQASYTLRSPEPRNERAEDDLDMKTDPDMPSPSSVSVLPSVSVQDEWQNDTPFDQPTSEEGFSSLSSSVPSVEDPSGDRQLGHEDQDEYPLLDDSENESDPSLDNVEEGLVFPSNAVFARGEAQRSPGPGEKYVVYTVRFETVRSFSQRRDSFEKTHRLRLSCTETEAQTGDLAQIRLILPGHNIFEMWGVLDMIQPQAIEVLVHENQGDFRRACLYVDTPSARTRLKAEAEAEAASTAASGAHSEAEPQVERTIEEVPPEDAEKMPIRRRLARMGMDDKINLALSGNREERMALAMDSNRAIHIYLLKNAKITLDEVAFMARLPSLNPIVLEKIAENPNYTQNLQVTKALVYNPKTPIKTAVRLLDRLPRPEVMNIAKRTQMHPRLVISAKNKLTNKKW